MARDAVPALIDALRDEDADVRRAAVRSLGWIGPEAKAALPALKKALIDNDSSIRVAAARSMEMIDPNKSARENEQ